ncbi:hypothetical protein [Legionella sp. km772]|uniref:hypothetical protein n=1 Tax=Legionella sp. km772 TaxID=2498111 RepID=UPI000F8F2537|nr:hypothetical protein [Legionella sp. km772]RUR13733.1 hypothetical protein ELY15_01510 [Legionella sp. km772]
MPFIVDLRTMQQPKIWTSRADTDAARRLQALYDKEDSEGYKKLLAELRAEYVKEKGNDKRELHDFRLTDGKVFEIWDTGRTEPTSIQFMVKGSVITWSFRAGKDETHQTWRDKVFNTAAIAHQNVEHGCETYYRGSNAYHLKKMHSHRGESDYNHNHYRLKEDRPITPKEVEEHLRAFYNQTYGKEFIPEQSEVDSIIGKYKMYWAEYELDPRYNKHYPIVNHTKRSVLFNELLDAMDDEQREKALDNYCAKIGVAQPNVRQAYEKLMTEAKAIGVVGHFTREVLKDTMERAAGSEFKSADAILRIAQMEALYPAARYVKFIAAFNEFNSVVNFSNDFHATKGYWPPDDYEVSEDDEYSSYVSLDVEGTHSKSGSPTSSVRSGSPSEQYNNAIDQMMT